MLEFKPYETVRVSIGDGYIVHIGSGVLKNCGKMIRDFTGARRVAVITDTNIQALYLERVMTSLLDAGMEARAYTIEAGEGAKTIQTFLNVMSFFVTCGLDKLDCAVALGGGIVGDVAGFATACYLHGIGYVQMPTNMLAAVDSTIGGMTSLNIDEGKNLIGTLWQPRAVLCDVDTLKGLPADVYNDGISEAIKTAIIADGELFNILESGSFEGREVEIVSRAVTAKAIIVERDERDIGIRALLGLGHVPGNAIEILSDYKISHGHAVAMGVCIMTRAAAALGYCDVDSARRIQAAYEANKLPVISPFSVERLVQTARSDRARRGDAVTVVFPRKIGSCRLEKVTFEKLESVFALGMEPYK